MATTKITLICLPFAGGSSSAYEPLAEVLGDFVQLASVELPGRSRRFDEAPLDTAEQMVEEIWRQIQHLLFRPYAFLGHSMGALLAYLLCHKIRQSGSPAPAHVFFSGREAPSSPPDESPEYLLPFADFKAKLASYGGIPDEILHDEAVFAFFEPMIRADFRAVQTWEYRPRPPLHVAATVLSGLQDELTETEVYDWQRAFGQPIQFEFFEGGHFFLFEQRAAVAEMLLRHLRARHFQNQSSHSIKNPFSDGSEKIIAQR